MDGRRSLRLRRATQDLSSTAPGSSGNAIGPWPKTAPPYYSREHDRRDPLDGHRSKSAPLRSAAQKVVDATQEPSSTATGSSGNAIGPWPKSAPPCSQAELRSREHDHRGSLDSYWSKSAPRTGSEHSAAQKVVEGSVASTTRLGLWTRLHAKLRAPFAWRDWVTVGLMVALCAMYFGQPSTSACMACPPNWLHFDCDAYACLGLSNPSHTGDVLPDRAIRAAIRREKRCWHPDRAKRNGNLPAKTAQDVYLRVDYCACVVRLKEGWGDARSTCPRPATIIATGTGAPPVMTCAAPGGGSQTVIATLSSYLGLPRPDDDFWYETYDPPLSYVPLPEHWLNWILVKAGLRTERGPSWMWGRHQTDVSFEGG